MNRRAVSDFPLCFDCEDHVYAVEQGLDYPLPKGFVVGSGAFSVILHRSFVDAVLAEVAQFESGANASADGFAALLAEMEFHGMADENYWQTSLLTSRFCNRHLHVSATFAFVENSDARMYASSKSDIRGTSPRPLTVAGYPHLLRGVDVRGAEAQRERSVKIKLKIKKTDFEN